MAQITLIVIEYTSILMATRATTCLTEIHLNIRSGTKDIKNPSGCTTSLKILRFGQNHKTNSTLTSHVLVFIGCNKQTDFWAFLKAERYLFLPQLVLSD